MKLLINQFHAANAATSACQKAALVYTLVQPAASNIILVASALVSLDNGLNFNSVEYDQWPTTIYFPFVTNQAGYDTGITLTTDIPSSFTAGDILLKYRGDLTGTPHSDDDLSPFQEMEEGCQAV